ncbi:ribosomal protection-like ABC-F family protein [Dysgonomonas sp. 520]|uniref:ribosomal protection-like ABC-F family protein n=1 Tax=Dysgonomonas sp. 520 TaxID=2302931 RepID=UPI0013D2CDB5|nr:ABC-F family ATP-binding cassette domain-containing protein [Dysgonomonas sp. 520]NDW08822.1 ABC transporter ATP-binding protein [Dysgonomonas sp. 520]
MSITINNISYIHSDKETLFQNISFSVPTAQKVSLIGKNGSGKSTLLKIIAGKLSPSSGEIISSDKPYYIPQHFGQYDNLTISQALGIEDKLNALHAILGGDASQLNFDLLNDDWDIEERALAALASWGLQHLGLSDQMEFLSGGEKTKVFLSGINIHSPSVVLLDEPTNHLDADARHQLYELIESGRSTIIVVSHDRTLLNLISLTYELHKGGVEMYGGNYEFYKIQKEEQLQALQAQLEDKEKALRQAKKVAREAAERKQRMDARGQKKQIKEGTPRIMMNTIKNRAEASASKLKDVHADKMGGISDDLRQIRQKLPEGKEMKLNFEDANLHSGKILVTAKDINFGYSSEMLWDSPLSFQIKSGDRIAIKGGNGKGKTTLLNIIQGKLEPKQGDIVRADFSSLYVDQEYSIIDNSLTVLEQIQHFNSMNLLEHEIKTILHRYLFPFDTWNKTCDKLSGGEKMRLVFCCLMVSNNTPDVFVLDEPTNNLDIQSLEIVTNAIRDYKGTLIVISHDQYFIQEVGVNQEIGV